MKLLSKKTLPLLVVLAMHFSVGAAAEPTDEDYRTHARLWKESLPEDFHVVIEKPFVVIGDEDPKTVERRAAGTVRWATKRLKEMYFKKDPNHIINIWLFKDKASYEANAWEYLGDRPSTPYGYYSPSSKALVMNISTGGGTLVHEIVHPFVAANFPDCPAWLNEGLGSLYEQCGERNGRITGFTNWRLSGLQRAIGEKRVPSFETLCKTSHHEFYNEDKGTNYAQARYLCYYLQERGLLAKYYHAFHKNADDDPGGYQTLVDILGEEDMLAFKHRWEEWVMELKYP